MGTRRRVGCERTLRLACWILRMEVRQVGPGGSAILTMVLTMLVMDQPNRPLPCFLSLCLFLFWGGGPANRHDSNDTITGDHNPGYDLSRAARVPSRSSQIDEASWGVGGGLAIGLDGGCARRRARVYQ
jgi:hypothetical protein